MKSPDRIFMGTQTKFLFDIKVDGFSMHDDDFEVILMQGNITTRYLKSDFVEEATVVGEETQYKYYLCFDSALYSPGIVYCVVIAYVPDEDFDGGIRQEVDKFALTIIDTTGYTAPE